MILCICRRTSDRDIVKAIESGTAVSLQDFQANGVADGCGCCHAALEEIIATVRGDAGDKCAGCPRAGSAACHDGEAAA